MFNKQFIILFASLYILSNLSALSSDNNDCFSLTVIDSVLIADAGPDQTITCDNPSATLGTTNSSTGTEICYEWTWLGNPQVFSDSNFVEVFQPGEYLLTVFDKNTNESVMDTVLVVGDIIQIDIFPDPPEVLTCDVREVVIEISLGTSFSYHWSTNGGNILSDTTLNQITVDAPGIYEAVVTDPTNGCSAVFQFEVREDVYAPFVHADPLGSFSCGVDSVYINSTSNLSSAEATYHWEALNGNILSDPTLPFITVDEPGIYTVTITSLENGCTDSSETNLQDNAPSAGIIANTERLTSCVESLSIDPCALVNENPYGFERDCIGYWVEEPGLIIDSFPIAIAERSGVYVFRFTDDPDDPEMGCVKAEFHAWVSIGTQEQADLLAADAGQDITYPDCLTSSIPVVGSAFPVEGTYAYEWSTEDGRIAAGSDQNTAFVSGPGIYELLVTDLNTGCTNVDEVEVFPSSDWIFIDVQTTDVSCFGESDGAASVVVSGGTAPYTFAAPPANLPAGTYTLDVSDDTGCGRNISFEIEEPAALAIDFVITPDGDLLANVEGGTEPYTYDWNVGGNTDTIPNPINGTLYIVDVIDANGCTFKGVHLFETTSVMNTRPIELHSYPNPTNDFVYIELEDINSELKALTIFDKLGRQIQYHMNEISADRIQLDVSNFEAGTFFLQASIGDDIYYQKLVVF